jgi:hypothetical protein
LPGKLGSQPAKKQFLTEVMKKKILSWDKKFKIWTADDWKKVLFSDERHFEDQGLRVTHVRRSDGESVSSKHMQQTIKTPLKIYSWAGFHATAVVPWYLLME